MQIKTISCSNQSVGSAALLSFSFNGVSVTLWANYLFAGALALWNTQEYRIMSYQRVLVAIDLSNESEKIISRAIELAGDDVSKLFLAHVVEPVAAAYPIDAYAINMTKLQEEAMAIAAQRLAGIGEKHGIKSDRQLVLAGAAATEIRSKAEELQADLIVIGSHGTSGWKLLLGSTANKVLHGANCDIMTVRVGK
jgi:universal stress protein A